ncbi:MAG: hypothetical protein M5R36_03395 [Deltaproteobacteria bacterium]|nr:hypothetical protein [Deltaproteobacteria bacterium]
MTLWAFSRLSDPQEPLGRGLAVFGVCAAAAMALRFEAWMFLPVWPIALWHRRGPRAGLLTAAVLTPFPILHMVESGYRAGHPLRFLVQAQHVAIAQKAPRRSPTARRVGF